MSLGMLVFLGGTHVVALGLGWYGHKTLGAKAAAEEAALAAKAAAVDSALKK